MLTSSEHLDAKVPSVGNDSTVAGVALVACVVGKVGKA